jgi:GTPase SAR1 family protein
LTFSYYRGAQVVVLVFDKSSVESFTSLDTFYNQSREKVDENTSTILVGNKTDLQPVISTEQGQSAARRFNAIYLEVSALTGENINNLFEVAAIEGMKVLQKNH